MRRMHTEREVMELEQLRQLDAIERCGTLSAAATELHTTQPSLSRSMQKLEAELGQDLFDRTRNRARLNDAGRLAVEHARAVLAEERRMRAAFDELAKRQRTLKVASVAPAPNWRLASLVVDKAPGIIVEPELVGGEDEARRRLLDRTCDLCITLRPMQLPTVRSAPLMTEDLFAALPEEHALAERASLSFADLDGEPFLVLEQVGFWMDVVRRNLPNSQVIVQKDQVVFTQLLRSTALCAFATDVAENDASAVGRIAVPIVDADAHATFFLNMLVESPERVKNVFEIVD